MAGLVLARRHGNGERWWEKLVEVVEGLLVCVGSIWFGGIETFQDIWRLGIVQKSL